MNSTNINLNISIKIAAEPKVVVEATCMERDPSGYRLVTGSTNGMFLNLN